MCGKYVIAAPASLRHTLSSLGLTAPVGWIAAPSQWELLSLHVVCTQVKQGGPVTYSCMLLCTDAQLLDIIVGQKC